MTDDEKINRLEEEIEKLKSDYAVLKYVIEKESLTDQLMKIFVSNASQQLPQLVELMKTMNVIPEKENISKSNNKKHMTNVTSNKFSFLIGSKIINFRIPDNDIEIDMIEIETIDGKKYGIYGEEISNGVLSTFDVLEH